MKLSDLGSSAQELLQAFAAQLVATNPNFPLPPNQYVGAGEIPWDGEGLYVYLAGGITGQPGSPQTRNIPATQGITFSVGFYVMLVRSVSSFGYWAGGDIDIPSDADLDFEGQRAVSDAGALLAAAAKIKSAKDIVTNSGAFVIGEVSTIGPQGGLSAVRLYLDLGIEQA